MIRPAVLYPAGHADTRGALFRFTMARIRYD